MAVISNFECQETEIFSVRYFLKTNCLIEGVCWGGRGEVFVAWSQESFTTVENEAGT